MSKFSLSVNLLAYDSPLTTNDPADAIKINKLIQEASVSVVNRNFPIQLANGAVNQVVPLPPGTSNYLMIMSDQVISITLNASATPMVCRPQISGTKVPVFIFKGDITSLSLSNSSGNTANVDVVCVKI